MVIGFFAINSHDALLNVCFREARNKSLAGGATRDFAGWGVRKAAT